MQFVYLSQMAKIELRLQRISDAKRFFEILNNPNFKYFPRCPKSIADEKKWLAENPKRRKNNTEWNYAILLDGKVVGGIGIKIDFHEKYIREIGYFVDEKFWGRGIATKAVRLAEKKGFKKLGLRRIEIMMDPSHVASKKVAVKCGYRKEGLLKKAFLNSSGKMTDLLLYAKSR